MSNTQTTVDVQALEHRLLGYLLHHEWSRTDVGISLIKFEDTHGVDKLAAMSRFIDWAESNQRRASWIAAQLGHDLNCCENKLASPRTGGY